MESEKIALVDLDGTLADFDKAMKDDMALLAAPGEENIDPWDRSKPWIKARKSLIMRQHGWWKTLDTLSLGFDVLNILIDLDFEVHVLTKGPSASSIAWGEKVEWCKQYLPPEVKITLTEDKGLVYGKVLVDDWPKYITRWLEWRPRGLVIMPAHKHNEGFEHPNVIRVSQYGSIDQYKLQFDNIRKSLERVLNRKSGEELIL